MTTVRLYFTGERIGPQFKRGTIRQRNLVLASVRAASQDVSDEILEKGQEDIGAASPAFASSPRWKSGLHVPVTEGGGSIRIDVQHDLVDVGFRVHQFGATIRAKSAKLLTIPFPGSTGTKGVSARDYPGKLIWLKSRAGNPILFASTGKGKSRQLIPKYIGKESVFVPKRFHVLEIAQDIARRIQEFYNRRLSEFR